jgi:hypothetical protein
MSVSDDASVPTPPVTPTHTPVLRQKAGWRALRGDFARRLGGPFRNPVFILYFGFIVFGVAGLGLWITVIRYFIAGASDANVALVSAFEAGTTYAIAISATALADIMLSKSKLRSFIMCTLALTVVVVACVAISFWSPGIGRNGIALSATVLSMIICLTQWWMINADNATLEDDEVDPTAATGGDPLAGLPGSLQAYRT